VPDQAPLVVSEGAIKPTPAVGDSKACQLAPGPGLVIGPRLDGVGVSFDDLLGGVAGGGEDVRGHD